MSKNKLFVSQANGATQHDMGKMGDVILILREIESKRLHSSGQRVAINFSLQEKHGKALHIPFYCV